MSRSGYEAEWSLGFLVCDKIKGTIGKEGRKATADRIGWREQNFLLAQRGGKTSSLKVPNCNNISHSKKKKKKWRI